MGREAFVVLMSVCLIAGCGVSETVVATVGERTVELDDLQLFLESEVGEPWSSVDARVAAQLLDQYLDQEVLAMAAGEPASSSAADGPGARSARVRLLLAEVCGEPPDASPDAVREAVARRMTERRPDRARVRQMLLDDAETAEAARRRLDAGERFEDVATALGRSAEAIGLPGIVARGTLPDELDEVVFALPEGGISRPVQGPTGYHILQVLEILPGGPPDPAEAEAEARRELEEQLRREFVVECVAGHARELGVTVYPEHLWFEYAGRYVEGPNAS
jgi:parvulin-like peptidyl-prolyl isomerase